MVHSFSGHIVHVPESALQLAKCAAPYTHTHTHTDCHTVRRRAANTVSPRAAARRYVPRRWQFDSRAAADLRPSADGSAVRTSPVAGQLQAASVPIA